MDVAKVKSCATLRYTDNEAYVDLRSASSSNTPRRSGMKPSSTATGVKQADSDFSTVATRIVAAKPDCVMLFTLGPSAANLAIQLKQAGLPASVKLIGQTGLSSPQLIQIGGAAVEGLVFNSDWTPWWQLASRPGLCRCLQGQDRQGRRPVGCAGLQPT